MPVELAAVNAMGFTGDKSAKVQSLLSDRLALVERQVIKNCGMALQLRDAMPRLSTFKELAPLVSLAEANRAMIFRPGLIQQLQTAGVVTNNEATALNEGVNKYRQAMNEDLTKAAGGDMASLMLTASCFNIRDLSREGMQAFEGLLSRAATKWSEIKGPAGVEADLSGSGPDAAAKALGTLTSEQQSKILLAVASPEPTSGDQNK